jgi:alpha-galactosidase
MIHSLENRALQFAVYPRASRWSASSRSWPHMALENIQLGLHYRRGWSDQHVLDLWRNPTIAAVEKVPSPHGQLQQLRISIQVRDREVSCELVFAVPEDEPFLIWKCSIENRGSQPIFLDRMDLLSAGFVYPSHAGLPGAVRLLQKPDKAAIRSKSKDSPFISSPGDLAFYSNGWQTWSYTGAYSRDSRYYRTRLGPLTTPLYWNARTPQPRHRGLFISDMFAVLADRTGRTGLLAGFLSQQQHFGLIEAYIGAPEPALRMWASGDGTRLDPAAHVSSDWAYLQFIHLDSPDPLGTYLEAVARENGLKDRLASQAKSPVGWCSWYQFSSEDFIGTITAEDLRENIGAIHRLSSQVPLRVIQLDDGFESRVGDWTSFAPGFPEGVAPLAREIGQSGHEPGLWLAPFLVHPKSKLRAEHPEWILRNRLGLPANAGFFWNSFVNALDLSHPGALDYARSVVHKAAHEWGFSYLKLDFLYGGALPGRHYDPTRTHAQILRSALLALREAAGKETFLLGCACPLGPAIGIVDGMRISPDTSQNWHPTFKGRRSFLKAEMGFPSTRNATHNTLTRAALHRRWWINDPDCLLLRPGTNLSQAEIQTRATVIALTGGSLMLSDHLPELPDKRLRIAEALLPLVGKRPHVLDWFDSTTPARLQVDLDGPGGSWHLLALFNWADQVEDISLGAANIYLDPGKAYYGREFWSGEIFQIPANRLLDEPVLFKQVPPHGVVLLALRQVRSFRPQYLGSDLHISQGMELAGWEWEPPDRLSLQLERPGKASGHIDLALPTPIRETGPNPRGDLIGKGLYRFPVEFERRLELQFILDT